MNLSFTVLFIIVMSAFYYVLSWFVYASFHDFIPRIKKEWNEPKPEPKSWSDIGLRIKKDWKETLEGIFYIPRRYGFKGYFVALGFVSALFLILRLIELYKA